eukprot:SAG31_NODE_2958_length_4852_cov_1.980644_7_plen_220_part_00
MNSAAVVAGADSCDCDAGYTGTIFHDDDVCEACSIGQYKDASGPAACTPCPTASTTDQVGSTSADQCNCEAGYVMGETGCTACPVGSYAAYGDEECTPCTDGASTAMVASTNVGNCTCNAGFATNVGIGAFNVSAGEQPERIDADSDICTMCPAGTYLAPSGCTSCPEFSTSPAASADVSTCTCQIGYLSSTPAVVTNQTTNVSTVSQVNCSIHDLLHE